ATPASAERRLRLPQCCPLWRCGLALQQAAPPRCSSSHEQPLITTWMHPATLTDFNRSYRLGALSGGNSFDHLVGAGEQWIALFRLEAGELDHLAPLLGFVGDELAKVSGREREHVATEVGKPRLDLGIGEASVDLLVEYVDDFTGVPLGAPMPYQMLAS